jgi:hypothetical protein
VPKEHVSSTRAGPFVLKGVVRLAQLLTVVLGLFGVMCCTEIVNAQPFDYSNPFSEYGVQDDFACGGKGACGAVSTVNSFVFLEKQYPKKYNNKLTPNAVTDLKTGQVTDPKDAQNFGFDGWPQPNPTFTGNYNRPGDVREQVYLDTKMDWINYYAPFTTKFDSWFLGSTNNNRAPTISDLAGEMKDHEDVELWVKGDSEFHVIILTDVKCDKDLNCSIRYQDPNGPTTEQPNTMVTVVNGMLQIPATPGMPEGSNRSRCEKACRVDDAGPI